MADDDNTDDVLEIVELENTLSEVEKPPLLPRGKYEAEIQNVTTPMSQKGNRYYSVQFVVPLSQVPADLQDKFEDDIVLYYNRVLVPTNKDRRAQYRARKFMEAIGIDTNTSTIDPNDWMGQTALLSIDKSTYQGEERNDIKAVLAMEEAPAQRRGTKPEPEEEEEEKPTPRGRRK